MSLTYSWITASLFSSPCSVALSVSTMTAETHPPRSRIPEIADMRRAHCALGSISRERGSWDTNAKAPPMLSIGIAIRSEEHTSELQSLMRISYAVFCLKKKTLTNIQEQQSHKKIREQDQYERSKHAP